MRNVLVILALGAAGCAPATIQGVRDDAYGRASLDVPLGYQEVYRRIITPARSCFQSAGLFGPTFSVQGDLYTDVRKAEISFPVIGLVGTAHPAVIDIAAQVDGRTAVVTYYWSRGWSPIAGLVRRWVEDGYTGCEMASAVSAPDSR